jgi:hypothetical protein
MVGVIEMLQEFRHKGCACSNILTIMFVISIAHLVKHHLFCKCF